MSVGIPGRHHWNTHPQPEIATEPDELLSNLPLERGAVRSMLRHGFHPPEAQQGGSFQIAQSVHPQGRIPFPGDYSTLIDTPRGKTTDRGPLPDGYPEPEPAIVVANDHEVVPARRKNRET